LVPLFSIHFNQNDAQLARNPFNQCERMDV
jgi:hypothetical protein